MKNSILSLIRDDIRLARITKALSSIEIETSAISTNNYLVILELLEKQDDQELSDSYYQMIESESEPEKVFELLTNRNV